MKFKKSNKCFSRGMWLSILFVALQLGYAQESTSYLSPEPGSYAVGFEHYTIYDSSRTYQRVADWTNDFTPRPISLSIWYPAHTPAPDKPAMTLKRYMQVLAAEEEWEYLPDEFLLNWFYYEENERNRSHLKKKTLAIEQAQKLKGKFPVIIYAPSLMASSVENFALCEYLASHGYMVIASPSKSDLQVRTNGKGAVERNIETQARDIEFVLEKALQMKQVDTDKIATMGFSLGGISDVVVKMKNKHIKAMVSLDGSIRYQYYRIKELPFTNLKNIDVPYMHMAQKVIPDSVMKKYDIDTKLNTDFDFYDELTASDAYKMRFHDLTHPYFSTMGVLFHRRNSEQDNPDHKLIASGKWIALYTLNFLNAYIQEDQTALNFIKSEPEAMGVPEGLISKVSKLSAVRAYDFRDFNDEVKDSGYVDIMSQYQKKRGSHQSFEIPESALNTLGLQLVFNPDKVEEGLRVLEFAVKLFPTSANLFDSLAEAYLFASKREKAIQNFEKSLELNPQNSNAIQRLKELK